jgi:2-phosphoglycerate kinase
MNMDHRWLDRSPLEMLVTFPWFRGEGFDRIVQDLLSLPSAPPIMVEGFRVLPRLVAPLLSSRQQAVWLVPTPEFRRAAFMARGSLYRIAGRTSDPDQALANLLARDEMFTDQVMAEARELDLPVIEIDVGEETPRTVERVAVVLGLDPPPASAPPHAPAGR